VWVRVGVCVFKRERERNMGRVAMRTSRGINDEYVHVCIPERERERERARERVCVSVCVCVCVCAKERGRERETARVHVLAF